MRLIHLLALLASTQLYSATPAASVASTEAAVAQFEIRDPKTKEVYFTGSEKTIQDGSAIRKETLYFNNDSKEVLKDSFAFDAKSLQAIDFQSKNAVTGEESLINSQAEGLAVEYRASRDAKAGKSVLKSDKQIYLASAAGDLIVMNWDHLMAGKSVKFELVIPSRMETIPFQLVRREALTVDNEERQVFTLMPQNFLIRMLAPHLEFQFSKDKKIRLAIFPSSLPIQGSANRMVEMAFKS